MDEEMVPDLQKLQPVQTLVFMDFEATGLPQDKPQITELCLIAVQRSELMSSDGNPRVLNKLQLCVNPRKPISAKVSELTGLYNDHLDIMPPFDHHLVHLFNQFLDRLPQPVCLLAHNGYGYDFPLLRTQLLEIEMELNEKVLCCDSLMAFRYLDGADTLDSHLPYLTMKREINPKTHYPVVCMDFDSRPGPSQRQNGDHIDPVLSNERTNRHQEQIQIDENCNLSADIITNQNIPNHVNDDDNDETVESFNSTPPDEEEKNNVGENIAEMSPPHLEEEHALANNGSPGNPDDEVDINLDPLHFKFANERTPPNKPPVINPVPRKIIAPQPRSHDDISLGNTKRQLNFEIQEPKHTAPNSMCYDSNERSAPVFGNTKRQLSFEMDSSNNQMESESGVSCNNGKRSNKDSPDSIAKRLCANKESHNSPAHNLYEPLHIDTNTGNAESFPQSSLEDDDLLCAVENTENNIDKVKNKSSVSNQKCSVRLNKNVPNPSIKCVVEGEPGPSSTSRYSSSLVQQIKITSGQNLNSTRKETPSKVSYSLPKLYLRIFDETPIASHSAEDDCVTLMRLVKNASPRFIQWVDSFSIPFSHIKPMY
ncbi:uncharacterized protein LOC126828911 [Patella vulgata]|uniref:uncharacterized protein LOC126828911 n=1 Tax=Patella vulgata TaxID=6465 RepID=UPI00217F30C0|nr:uncharacterized protein LOC126828911 [Patella vulgata]